MLEKLYIPLNTQKHRKKAWLEYWSRHINLIKKQEETELHSGYVTIRKILEYWSRHINLIKKQEETELHSGYVTM